MPESMIERMADAIQEWNYVGCGDYVPDCPGGLSCPANREDAARVLLATMREPTGAMVAAAPGYGDADWPAMIDAALTEE